MSAPKYTCPNTDCGYEQDPLLHTADSDCGGEMHWDDDDLVCQDCGKRNGYLKCDECGHETNDYSCLSGGDDDESDDDDDESESSSDSDEDSSDSSSASDD